LSAMLVIHAACGQPERPSLSLSAGDGGGPCDPVRLRPQRGPVCRLDWPVWRPGPREQSGGEVGQAVGGLAQCPIKMPGIGEHRHHQRLGQGEPV
jgi:hypothetical protein